MIYVALGAWLAVIVVGTEASIAIRSLVRSHARERELLINQIMHLAGRTWTPPPADTVPDFPPDEETDRFVFAPSQLPDDEE